MTKNEGPLDRIIRAIAAIILAGSGYLFVSILWLKIVLFVVSGILVFTAITGFCGLYPILGINTCKVDLSPPEQD